MTGVVEEEHRQTILVGVDGSQSSEDALRWAAEQARLTQADLEVVMTWEFPTTYGWAPIWPEGYNPAEDTQKVLDHEIEAVLGARPDVRVTAVVLEGHAAPILVERSSSAALAVVGSRGHGAFAGMLLGSVSEHLAAHARCPVVIVHGLADKSSRT